MYIFVSSGVFSWLLPEDLRLSARQLREFVRMSFLQMNRMEMIGAVVELVLNALIKRSFLVFVILSSFVSKVSNFHNSHI